MTKSLIVVAKVISNTLIFFAAKKVCSFSLQKNMPIQIY